jgi:4-amino-4-deoxy-L-arabinose transferase-like glycosyltransferase
MICFVCLAKKLSLHLLICNNPIKSPMAKNKLTRTQGGKTISNPVTKKAVAVKKDLLDNIDEYFQKHSKLFLSLSLGISVLFSILIFDVKVGIGGDDSAYILRASDFIKNGTFPSYQGPLYPFILSPFIAIFGIKLILLKILSLVFIIASIYFFYKGFSKVLPQSIVSIAIILLSFNYYLLYFSSQTYSEAFFIMLEAILFWYLAVKFFRTENDASPFSNFIILGLILFLMAITRSIAYIALIAVVGYFVLQKQWKNSIKVILGFLIFFVAFEILKNLIWDSASLQFASQSNSLLNKNFYNPTEGKEDFAGFINRLLKNSNQYFSKHFFKFLGFREEVPQTNVFLTLLTWFMLGLAFFQSIRKNKYMLIISIYTISVCVTTFLILQVNWDQWRLIIIVFPFLLVLLFGNLYYLLKHKKMVSFQFILPLLAIIILLTSFGFIGGKVKVQKEILARNLKGDLLYGLTPDWINYIEMSKWAAKNTPADVNTGVRKPEISFIYTNRNFQAIRDVPSITADSLLQIISDTAIYVGIKMDIFVETDIFADSQLKQKTVGFINGKFSFGNSNTEDGSIVGIYKFTKTEFPYWETRLKKSNIYFDSNIKSWIIKLKANTTDFSVYVPEILIERLHKAKVKYLLLASLRANPNFNTGNIITTLHRYVNFIQLKYPNSFVLINTIGTEEPAQLVEFKI